MNTRKIGIASYEQMKARTLAIAKGTLKPGSGEPKVWVTSKKSLERVLSAKNRVLLDLIQQRKP